MLQAHLDAWSVERSYKYQVSIIPGYHDNRIDVYHPRIYHRNIVPGYIGVVQGSPGRQYYGCREDKKNCKCLDFLNFFKDYFVYRPAVFFVE